MPRKKNYILYLVICPTCGKEFQQLRQRHKFCCELCYRKDSIQKLKLIRMKNKKDKICPVCKNTFIAKYQNIYCSKDCQKKLYNEKSRIHGRNIKFINPEYYEKRKRKKAERASERRKTDENFRIRSQKISSKCRDKRLKNNLSALIQHRIRSLVHGSIKRQYTQKCYKTIDLLGIDYEGFKQYFESKFKQNMTWEKFQIGEIQIDHIKPCSLFDFTDPEQQKECFHYTNLQPLWKEENRIKGNQYPFYQ